MDIQVLGEVNLTIPAWQMGLFIGLVSLSMLWGRTQLGLIVSYLFVFYWGFILYWPSFASVTESNPLAMTFYICCGLAIAFLALLTFFYQSA